MRHAIAVAAGALGFLLLLNSCSAGGYYDSPEPQVDVASGDGMAVLTLQPSLLPPGIAIEDISVDWVEGSSNEPGAPFAAVVLAPSGIQLSSQATLRVKVPQSTDQLMVIQSSAAGFEFVEWQFVERRDAVYLRARIDHFGVLALYDPDLFAVDATADPPDVTVGDSQQVRAEIDFNITNVPLWMWVGAPDENVYQFFEFNVTIASQQRPDPLPFWVLWFRPMDDGILLSRGWEPNNASTRIPTDGSPMAMSVSSQCVAPNTDRPHVQIAIEITMTLIEKGDVIDAGTLDLIEPFDAKQNFSIPNQGVQQGTASLHGVDMTHIPFTLGVGETIEGSQLMRTVLDSQCVAEPQP